MRDNHRQMPAEQEILLVQNVYCMYFHDLTAGQIIHSIPRYCFVAYFVMIPRNSDSGPRDHPVWPITLTRRNVEQIKSNVCMYSSCAQQGMLVPDSDVYNK